MSFLQVVLNVIWILLGGLEMALGWWLAGLIMFVTIIGIPWGRSCFVIGVYSLLPFGREVVSRREATGQGDLGTGPLGCLGNIIWFVLAGVWLALGHLALALSYAITIIGIPFALKHLHLARLTLAPVGLTVVDQR